MRAFFDGSQARATPSAHWMTATSNTPAGPLADGSQAAGVCWVCQFRPEGNSSGHWEQFFHTTSRRKNGVGFSFHQRDRLQQSFHTAEPARKGRGPPTDGRRGPDRGQEYSKPARENYGRGRGKTVTGGHTAAPISAGKRFSQALFTGCKSMKTALHQSQSRSNQNQPEADRTAHSGRSFPAALMMMPGHKPAAPGPAWEPMTRTGPHWKLDHRDIDHTGSLITRSPRH